MRTIFRGVAREAARSGAMTAARALREIPAGQKG
jgi:hypothetical protein